MAIAFIDLLKDVENANRTGFKEGKGWVPHRSAEGGTRTLAYGHKLSSTEDKGNFVELPNGEIVEFSERGLTNEEAEMLLQSDVAKAKKVAAKQWNQAQDVPFEDLKPLDKNLLSEIVFNIGTLRNDKGKFGWPSLAEGIKTNDPEKIKAELMRSFTDPEGNKKQLTRRVNKIREYVDNPDLNAEILVPDAPQPQQPQIGSVEYLDNVVAMVTERLKGRQEASETPSEARTEPEPVVEEEQPEESEESGALSLRQRAAMAVQGRARNTNEEKLERTANEAELESTARKAKAKAGSAPTSLRERAARVLQGRRNAEPRASGTRETERPVRSKPQGGQNDGSKDPIFGIF